MGWVHAFTIQKAGPSNVAACGRSCDLVKFHQMNLRNNETLIRVVLVAVLLLALAACAAGPNPAVGLPDSGGSTAGFFMGLWHGVIAPFTFVISLFTTSVSIYEVHNSGNWYDFGFALGAGILFGGGMFGSRR